MPQALQAMVTAELNVESMFNHISPQDQLNPKLTLKSNKVFILHVFSTCEWHFRPGELLEYCKKVPTTRAFGLTITEGIFMWYKTPILSAVNGAFDQHVACFDAPGVHPQKQKPHERCELPERYDRPGIGPKVAPMIG